MKSIYLIDGAFPQIYVKIGKKLKFKIVKMKDKNNDTSSMIQNLEQIEYRRGMLSEDMKPEDLPMKVLRGAKIPSEIGSAVGWENLLDLSGLHGDKIAGKPVEYDRLKLILGNDEVKIKVFKRSIALLKSNDERVRSIHRLLCKLDQSWESR